MQNILVTFLCIIYGNKLRVPAGLLKLSVIIYFPNQFKSDVSFAAGPGMPSWLPRHHHIQLTVHLCGKAHSFPMAVWEARQECGVIVMAHHHSWE